MTLLDIRYYMTLKFIEVCVESVGLRNVDHYFRTMPPYREVISFLGPHVTEGTNPWWYPLRREALLRVISYDHL